MLWTDQRAVPLTGMSDLDMKSQIFPGLFLYWYMEVGVLEIYLGNPLPLLERRSDGLRCLHLEFLRLEEKIEFAQI